MLFAIQDKDCFIDLITTYQARGNDVKFIESRKSDFEKFHNLTANTKFEKAYIHRGEHLYDALTRLGIKLEKGKGYKNYI